VKGILGIREDEEFLHFFTGNSEEFLENEMHKVGEVDCSFTGVLHPHHIPGKISEMFPDGGDLEFYLFGHTSNSENLTYIPIHESVLMGYEKASKSAFGSVYYFSKCGEIKGVPVFTYSSDMVIGSKQIKWVNSHNIVEIPNSLAEQNPS